jgi:hypothetical protein
MMWRSSQKEKLLATMQAHTSRGAVPDIGVVPMRLENVQQKQSAPAGAYLVWQIRVASVGRRHQAVLAHTAGWDQDMADLAAPDRNSIV